VDQIPQYQELQLQLAVVVALVIRALQFLGVLVVVARHQLVALVAQEL
jgi:hypothetical protein